MKSHAPAHPAAFDVVASDAVDRLRNEGKRKPGSLSDPGSISKELAAALAKYVPSDLIGRRIEELVNATRMDKDGNETPDIRAREAGLKLALAYKVGTPIARAEIISVNLDADNTIGLTQRLANSPALLKSLKQVIAQVEGGEIVSVEQ